MIITSFSEIKRIPLSNARQASASVNSHNRHFAVIQLQVNNKFDQPGRKRRGLSPSAVADSVVSDKTNETAPSWPVATGCVADARAACSPARRVQCNHPPHLLAQSCRQTHTYTHVYTIWTLSAAAIAIPGLYSVFKFRTKTGGAVKLPRSQSSHRPPLSCLPLTYPPDSASLFLSSGPPRSHLLATSPSPRRRSL